jgi:nucleotide-binding universal stress UspA family protein
MEVGMFSTIVVGTDGSTTARTAVDKAAALAKQSGASLHLVSAYKAPSQIMAMPMAEAMMAPGASSDQEVHDAVESMLRDLAKELEQQGINVAIYACPESPADALLDVAKHQAADLIVVGSRGMTGARRVLGSVPNSVAHHAECSVLIVHTC